MKKISIIVPVYNVENDLKACLDSLINQTFQDIEIVVVNDGSTDNSQSIIDEYVKNYPEKIKPYIKENGGISDTRNYGLQHASGEYVAFLDSDDTFDLNCLEVLYNNIIEADADIATMGYKVVVEGKGVTLESSKNAGFDDKKSIIFEGNDIIREVLLQKKVLNFTGTRLCKKELLHQFPCGVAYEDIVYTVELFMKAKRIICINDSFYNYKIRSGSISRVYSDKNLNDFADAMRSRYEIVKENYQNLHKYNMYALLVSTAAISSRDVLLKDNYSYVKSKVDDNIKIINEYSGNPEYEEDFIKMLNDYEKICVYLMRYNQDLYYSTLIENRRLRELEYEKQNKNNK